VGPFERAGGDEVRNESSLAELERYLGRTLRVRHGAERVGAVSDDVGPVPARAQLLRELLLGALLVLGAHEAHLGPEHAVQQPVPLDPCLRAPVPAADQVALQAQPGRGGGRLAGVVALRGRARNDAVGAFRQRVREREAELAGLVAAKGEAGQVVALEEQPAHAERLRQAGALVERGRDLGQLDPGQAARGFEQGFRRHAFLSELCAGVR
jgi:hypothetical protein